MSLIARLSSGLAARNQAAPDSSAPLGTDEVHVYNVTWGIPESMGGMTTAALRRIRSFQDFGRSLSQTLLTFSPRMDVDEIRSRLVSEGRMSDDVELINIWQDLRSRSDSGLAALGGMAPTGFIPEEDGEVESATDFFDIFRSPRTNKIIRRHYLRNDGSLLLVDVLDPKHGRRFILHSSAGEAIAEWRRPRDFYNAWISATVTKEPAVVIVDDKKVSEFIHEISHRTFGLVLFMHGTHLRHPWNGPHGQILPRRVETMRNFDRFDVVGVQTEQQAEAIAATGITKTNIKFLTGELPSGSVRSHSATDRPVNTAVMIANLIALKRVDHPIRAVAQLRDRGIDVTLTVLGEGAERHKLEQLITDLDVGDRVELPGYVNDVPARLLSSSFSVLTSTSEGLPLSMMESMGAGCVPIVYDITYGPRDLVEQGKNGYITPRGDIDALARQIESFLSLDSDRITSMRGAAMETVEKYLPEAGYRRWRTVLEELKPMQQLDEGRHQPAKAITADSLVVTPASLGSRVEIELSQVHGSTAKALQLVLTGRTLNTFFLCTNPTVADKRLGRRIVLTFEVDHDKFSESRDEIFDVHLRRPHDLWESKRRIRTPEGFRPKASGEREWYSTKHGNLSVRPRA